MSFSLSPRAAALGRRGLFAVLCASLGFVLGIWLGTHAFVGCRSKDLTAEPDTSFLTVEPSASPAPSALPSPSPEPEATPQATAVPEKRVCLTFDDGPSKNTKSVLDTLSVEKVPATFFVVASGYNNEYLPLLQRAQQEGHQIALHSASHDYSKIYQSSEAYWDDMELLCERISPYVDVNEITCLRFPGGSTNTVSRKYGGTELMKQLKSEAEQRGYHWVDWNVCAEDAAGGHPSSGTVYQNIVKETGSQKTCIVLMHDSATTGMTAEALPDIIAWYRDQGYAFCTVNDLYADQD
jgi:peptidoglycan/xylan/chitin deacetylase (PgdA/CDA1 family)